MQWIRIAAVAFVAVAVTWVAIPARVCPPETATVTIEEPFDAPPPIEGVRHVAPHGDVARITRNPFDYVWSAAKPVAALEPAPRAATSVAALQIAQQLAVEQVPSFPYRYIGRFGPAHNPIAAFARDGTVLTVRRGDTIDGRFVVRAIGANDVEIGIVNREATLRLSLDGWI